MSEEIVILMIGVSTFLGLLGLLGLLWAVRSGQFDDHKKFTNATHFDNEEDLQAAAALEGKRRLRKKNQTKDDKEENFGYSPPD